MVNQLVMAAAAGLAGSSAVAPETLLPLPPMGFNNWARFTTNISEAIFVDAAKAMAETGLLAAGYNRINLDDAWSTMDRAANGSMVWDDAKFPKGFYWLTEHLKSMGFLPGIYTDAGRRSCGGYPGALDYEQIDLDDFTRWGFEYLKMDGCNMPGRGEAVYRSIYGRWNKMLRAAEKPMIFSNSAPAYFSGRGLATNNLTNWYLAMGWAQKFGQLARHSADIVNYPSGNAWASMQFNYNQHVRLARYQIPGFFNDPDFLLVDHPSFSLEEKKSQFALWCAFSAPLILSTEMSALKREEIAYLTNKHLLAVNQDRLVQQATLVSRDGAWDVLSKSLENGDRVIAVLNKGSTSGSITVSWDRIGLSPDALLAAEQVLVSVQDLWTGESVDLLATESRGVTAENVPSHGTAVFRLKKSASAVTPTGLIFNTRSMKCLTDQDGESTQVRFATCNGSDGQTWRVRSDGHIHSLLRRNECLVDVEGEMSTDRAGCQSNAWRYETSGNLIHGGSGRCLTEGADGRATAAACGIERNEQVVGLPIGVTVVGN